MTARSNRNGKESTPPSSTHQNHRTARVVAKSPPVIGGQALLKDMDSYREKVSASPDAARGFLTRLGVMTLDGTLKTLIRG